MQFEVRKNAEYILIVDAVSEQDAIEHAEKLDDDEWEQAHSPITAEKLSDDE